MSRVEVLVACMGQVNDELYKTMNLQTDAILANQADEFSYREYAQDNGCNVKLISTHDRGVGKNRNKALMFATGEYLLCADDDMIYYDGYENTVVDAFFKRSDADIIIFNLRYLNSHMVGKKAVKKFKRIHTWNAM